MANCYLALKKLYPDVPSEVLAKFDKDMDAIKARVQKDGNIGDLNGEVQKYLENFKKISGGSRQERFDNIVKRSANRQIIDKFEDKKTGIIAKLARTEIPIEGANAVTVMGRAATEKSVQQKMLRFDLEKKGLDKIAKDGTLDREISEAVHNLATGSSPKIPISQEAMSIAKTYHALNKYQYETKRAVGLDTREVMGHQRPSHDGDKVRAAGFQDWANKIIPGLDHQKSFSDGNPFSPESQRELLETYTKITEGSYGLSDQSLSSEDHFDFYKNEKVRSGKSLTLQFKDGVSFHDYNAEFGRGNLFQTMWNSIDANSRTIAITEVLGTKPEDMLKSLIKDYNIDAAGEKEIKNVFFQLRGYSSLGGDSMVAKTASAVRQYENISKLGGTLISSVADWGVSSAIYRSLFGTNYLSAHGTLLKQYIGGYSYSKKDKNIFLERLGISVDDMVQQTLASAGLSEKAFGGIAQFQRFSFWASGMETHATNVRMIMAKQFSLELRGYDNSKFSDMPERVKFNLAAYGIKENEWDIIRLGKDEVAGQKLLTPEAIRDLPDSVFEEAIAKLDMSKTPGMRKPTVFEYKREISNRLQHYLNDNANYSASQPDIRTQARIIRGTTQDEMTGQILRFFGQFKSFPLTFHQVFTKVALANPERTSQSLWDATAKGKGDMVGMAGLILSLTTLGYISRQINNLRKGKELEDPTSPDVILESAGKGGALGLYGDLLKTAYDVRNSQQPLVDYAQKVAGPTFGTAIQTAKGAYKTIQSKDPEKQMKLESLRLLKGYIPLGNHPVLTSDLPFMKQSIDSLIWEQIYEASDLDYPQRKEQRKINLKGGF